jgi:autotransporter-associated beta strand protein
LFQNIIKFITTPTLSNGLMAYAVYANSSTANPQDFAAYDATNGVVQFTNYVALPASGGSAATTHILTGAQTLTGGVTTNALKINGGTLNLGSSNLTFGNNAGQILSVGALNADTITTAASSALNFTNAFGSANIIVDNSLDIGTAANPVLVSAVSVYKSGPGELRLSAARNGASSASTEIVIAQGGVKPLASNALAASSGAAAVVMAPGTTFDINSFGTAAAPVTTDSIQGFGTVKLGTGALATGAASFLAGTATFGGSLDGAAGSTLIKNGTGTLFLNGNSPNFAGGVRVLNGIMTIDADVTPGNAGSPGPLGTGTTPVQLGDTSGTSTATLGLGNQLTQLGRDIVVPAGVPNTTAISLTIDAGGQAATGGVATVSGNITLGRELRLDWPRVGNGTVAGAVTLTGVIADGGGTGSIDVHGGNWNFWGNNTYSGRTYFEAGGISYIVGVGTDSAFGTGPVIIANQSSTVTFRADNGPRTLANMFTFEGGASGTTANAVGFVGVNDLTFTSPTVDLAAATRT